MTLAEREIVVIGPRVRLRAFTLQDVDAWQEWPDYEEPLIVGTSPRRMTQQQRAYWFNDLLQRQRQIPYAIDDEQGRLIGRLFLRQVREDEGSAVLGIDLHPAKLGQGYGTEALACFLERFFGEMGFSRMLLSVAAFNDRARRSYESLGFRTIGSHWDAHSGPDVTGDARYRRYHQYLRRGPLGLEALYFDMSLERAAWIDRQR
jgi:RimJ/RimL family protein N-acetyltransferase